MDFLKLGRHLQTYTDFSVSKGYGANAACAEKSMVSATQGYWGTVANAI